MNDWYYKVEGRESGPCRFETIAEMAAAGSLKPGDELRRGEGDWMAAKSVVGLYPPEELSDLSQLDFTLDGSSKSEQENLRAVVGEAVEDEGGFDLHASADAQVADGSATGRERNSDEDAWYYRSLGHELGPMPLAEMIQLAVDGTISADDPVRKGHSAGWSAASTVDVLMPILAAAARAATSANDPPPVAATPERNLESTIVSPAATKPPPEETEDPRDGEPETEAVQTPAAAVSSLNPDLESALATRWFCNVDGVEYGPLEFDDLTAMAAEGRISRTDQVRQGDDGDWMAAADFGVFADSPNGPLGSKPIVRKPKRVRGPRKPLMPKVKKQAAENWRVLAGITGMLLVVGLIALFNSGLFGTADAEYLNTLTAIYNKHKLLKTRKASPDKWEPLVREAQQIKSEMVPVLKKTASAESPLRQELLWAVQDLVPMLQAYKDGEAQNAEIDHEKRFAGHLENAKKLHSGQEPDTSGGELLEN